jgi:hypothetical protein
MDVGGLVNVIPVLGLTMGMTLRVRTADGCWKLILRLLVTPECTNELVDAGDKEMDGATCWTG